MQAVKQILSVIRLAEQLKRTLRHSWLSDGRAESVAEHTWRVSLMALLVAPHLDEQVDVERLLKIVIIHDLVEAIAGDIPAFELMRSAESRTTKRDEEQAAISAIAEMLPDVNGIEILSLWREFESKNTLESKVANALDKLEAQIQHNEASLATWLDIEKGLMHLLDQHTFFDTFLDELRNQVVQETTRKLASEGPATTFPEDRKI
ncbi:putative hydrolase of HD superfamily [Trinickia symbiotica]|uniref:HD domain-containing protein n=1 Tax=Trinickia symbiotica TaxID=863227 RepID=A0A2N7X6T6_9BURK|nr:HD domain-containing protein [Trinickia symbiotica]PMS37291.1 HD domain-containing protein [Trinickia symbiotica]PPK42627.1 putative hydrolase of HD superfamily [Trinickia symbiotica]